MIVCTYNRAEYLLECLKHILGQTWMPTEVVIVDASDYWEETLKTVEQTYADHWSNVRLVYEPAKVRSIPHQRNQALELSQCDVIFSLDDDIYLYPPAAEIIMNAYQLDVDESVAMIGGQFAERHPDSMAAVDETRKPGQNLGGRSIKSWLEQFLSLDHHFVPYDKSISRDEPPGSLRGQEIYSSGLINGGRTTFRRKFGIQVKWTNLLRYYATHEDSDFSYRMSSFGRLLVAPDAIFFHADGNDDRANRFKINTIRVRNLMALHRDSSPNKFRSGFRLLLSFCFFAALYTLIDPARKRYTFPIVRAYLLGIVSIPFYMFYPFRDFETWYLAKQEKMYHSN